MEYKFLGNILISGLIKCETALHIGGMIEGYEIGGMDNPVIKDPISGFPYIPGSSIKGKLRSLLEWSQGLVITKKEESKEEEKEKVKEVGEVHICDNPKCPVCRVFGTPAEIERKIGPTRILVRDAYPDDDTKKILEKLQSEKGLPKAEWKTENVINRITSKATPRTIERVPQGSKFRFEIVYGIYQVYAEKNIIDLEYLKYLFEAMRLLEDSALGGFGSRGSGKISFEFEKILLKKISDYEEGRLGTEIKIGPLKELQFEKLKDEISENLSKNE
ncbi:MAG: type III-A CRISPR-associated RAMP protein Csm3 [Candidatus Altiarchaeota archaeon]